MVSSNRHETEHLVDVQDLIKHLEDSDNDQESA